ncbi:MMPL family transporter [Paenibacillaceae bacterium]|nr:MMPL family transporter [Paenibacillaceae bacterium]
MGYRLLGLSAIRYPRTVLLLWLAAVVLLGPYAARLPAVLGDHGLLADGSFQQAQRLLAQEFGIPGDPVIIMFEKQAALTQKEFHRQLAQTMIGMQKIEDVTIAIAPFERADMIRKEAAYGVLGLREGQTLSDRAKTLEQIRSGLPEVGSGVLARLTGKPVVQADVNEASRHDLGKAEMIGLPVAFFILLFAFGGVLPALLPLLIGLIAVTLAMGMLTLLGQRMELSNFVLSVVPMVGLALSIDFALIIISRYRQELLIASTIKRALAATMATAGRAVVFSGACVMLGLAGVLFIPLPIFRTVALGAMAVLTAAVLLTISLLPALLVLLGPLLQSGRFVSFNKQAARPSRAWVSWSRFVMKRPVLMITVAAAILIGALLPVRSMKLIIPDASSLPASYESRVAAEAFEAHFKQPGVSEIDVIAIAGRSSDDSRAFDGSGTSRTSGFTSQELSAAYQLSNRLERDPNVVKVDSIFTAMLQRWGSLRDDQLEQGLKLAKTDYELKAAARSFIQNNYLLMRVTLNGEPGSEETGEWLRKWEQIGQEQGRTDGLTFLLGGEAKYRQEIVDSIFSRLHKVLLFIGLTNFLVLLIAFRSIAVPLKAIFMNLLSIAAAFGILVFVFERGLLGMEAQGIAIMIPVFIFGLAFGISMDYGVFLLSSIFEKYRTTRNHELALREGLASTGRIITSAAAILIAVTLPFAYGQVIGVQQLGVGIAAAIIIDATIIRMMLVPALMTVLGGWNWWLPGRSNK